VRPGRINNLILDSIDPDAIATFWCTLLGVEVVEQVGDGHYVELGAAAGGLPIVIQRVPEPKATKNRMHPDIVVADLEEATREIERLGGVWRDGREHDEYGFRWRVMADPEGNEFCIFPASNASDEDPAADAGS
jgi:predicted enzyme related to lactoylglutathione lyase